MRIHRLSLFASIALLIPSCADPEEREDSSSPDSGIMDVPNPVDPPEADPGDYLEGIDGEFRGAADEFDVPVEILQAMGYAETQWQMIAGEEEFEGWAPAMGAMALRGDSIEIGRAHV